MFDMGLWDDHLVEFCQNAEKDGATPCDLLELLHWQRNSKWATSAR